MSLQQNLHHEVLWPVPHEASNIARCIRRTGHGVILANLLSFDINAGGEISAGLEEYSVCRVFYMWGCLQPQVFRVALVYLVPNDPASHPLIDLDLSLLPLPLMRLLMQKALENYCARLDETFELMSAKLVTPDTLDEQS